MDFQAFFNPLERKRRLFIGFPLEICKWFAELENFGFNFFHEFFAPNFSVPLVILQSDLSFKRGRVATIQELAQSILVCIPLLTEIKVIADRVECAWIDQLDAIYVSCHF